MPSPDDLRDIVSRRADAWFAVEIAFGGLFIHYVLGTPAVIMFLFGWWWGETRRRMTLEDGRLPPEDDRDDWSGIE
jgi:hypothetical protein